MARSGGRLIGYAAMAALVLVAALPQAAQGVKLPDVFKELPGKVPSVEKLLEGKPPITTSLADAVTEVPFLDDFDPKDLVRMTVLPRGPRGGFLLKHPGLYQLQAQSYCLHAGTYAPGEGDGYLYAPLEGPRSGVIRRILQNSVAHPQIKQSDIQTLIWAILSRTKLGDMAPAMQATAAELLPADDIKDLNGGALGIVPDEVLERAKSKLPPVAQQIMEAEARLRAMLTQPGATFAELERVAVLTGDVAPPEGSRVVPSGRWSYHPDGYFIRFFPSGYSRTTIQMYVPEHFTLTRDQRGRIVSVRDDLGNRVATDYDDTVEPLEAAGDSGLRGYAFSSIRFVHREAMHPEKVFYYKAEWKGIGWTLVGVPSGNGTVQASSGRYSGAGERRERAMALKQQSQQLCAQVARLRGRKSGGRIPDAAMADVVDLGHYAVAVKEAVRGSETGKGEWVAGHVDFLKRAWQYALSRAAGESEKGGAAGGSGPLLAFPEDGDLSHYLAKSDGSQGDSECDPSGDTACPGNTGKQRLAESARPADEPKDDCGQVQAALAKALFLAARYADPNRVQNAKSAKDYDESIDEGIETSTDAWVGSDCQLRVGSDGKVVTFDEFRDFLRNGEYRGSPEAVIEAIVAHERKHMEQCMKQDGFGGPDTPPQRVSDNEKEAYCAEAQKLADFLNQNCGGVSAEDTAEMQKLCGG